METYRNREITFRQPSGPPRAPQGTIILTNARGTTKNGSDFSENCRKSARGLSANQRVSSWEGGTVGALGLKNPTGPGVPSHSGSVVYIMGSVFCVAGPTHPYNGMGEDQGCRSNFPSRLAILTARQSALLHCMRQGLLSTVVSNAFGQTRLSCQ